MSLSLPDAPLLTALAAAALVWLALSWTRSPLSKLPTPPDASFLWGHEKAVFMDQPGAAFRRWTASLGLTFRIKAAFGARDVLVLSDPDGIAHILQKRIYDYHHSKVVRPRVARLLGKGLGWIEGESEHKRMKRLVIPSLSAENIKGMTQDVRDAAAVTINELTNTVLATSDSTLSCNVLDWTSRATLNVIGRVAFQHDFEGGDSPQARAILEGRKRGVSKIAQYAGFLTLMLLRRFPILNDLPIAAIQAQGAAKQAVQDGVAHEMVERNQILIQAQSEKRKDLLARLLVAHAEGKISEAELYEQISTFVISGHETTTQTLGFSIWELARQPELQTRLRTELQEFGVAEPSYDDFQNRLPFLDAVLRETLRLYPGLPYMERIAMKPDVIPLRFPIDAPGGGKLTEVVVSKGQTVIIPVIALQRLDSVWADPDAFRPERWLAGGAMPPAEQLVTGWSNTLAFSDGPRSCIGMRLAIFQYKVILAAMMQRFSFEDLGAEIELKISSSLQPWVKGKKEEGAQLPVRLHLL